MNPNNPRFRGLTTLAREKNQNQRDHGEAQCDTNGGTPTVEEGTFFWPGHPLIGTPSLRQNFLFLAWSDHAGTVARLHAREAGRVGVTGRVYARAMRVVLGLLACLTGACGSSATTIPSAPIYSCKPETADSGGGCLAPTWYANAPKDSNLYPEGCVVTLPVKSACCGVALDCTCSLVPMATPDGGIDSGLEFICPG